MGFKDILIEVGLLKGKYASYSGEFDLDVAIETVEEKFAKTFVSLKNYGHDWKITKEGSVSSGKVVFYLSLGASFEGNEYIIEKKGPNNVHISMTIRDNTKSKHADYIFKRDKKLFESMK